MKSAHSTGQLSRLRRRIILIAIGSVSLALVIICASINILNRYLITQRADETIRLIHDNGEVPAKPPRSEEAHALVMGIAAEAPFKTRYFVATIDDVGGISLQDTSHIAAIGKREMIEMTHEIVETGRQSGYIGTYRFSAFDDDGDRSIVVLDCSTAFDALTTFRDASIGVCGVCALIILAVFIPLSRHAVGPLQRSMELERRFVADASHEIKTPIAIIAANNDLLERIDGPSRWIESSRTQIERIDDLVRSLIELARAEEPLDKGSLEPVELSQLARDVCDEFQSLAEARGRTITVKTEGSPTVMGSKDDLERLLGILLDNAIKYCEGEGGVSVTLTKTRRRWNQEARLAVTNPCTPLSNDDVEHMFDRFYRVDPSRARKTGSYGIGLALARAIVTKHRGAIAAENTKGSVTIVVTLPSCTG